jgi:hypothetical protein
MFEYLLQAFLTAPMFVFLDLFFSLGYRPKLYAELRIQVRRVF